MLQCAICSSNGRETAGVSLQKVLKDHDYLLRKELEEAWVAVTNQKNHKKPFQIKNIKDEKKKTYERRSFKERQAVKSLALEIMQKGSGQQIFNQLQDANQFQVSAFPWY